MLDLQPGASPVFPARRLVLSAPRQRGAAGDARGSAADLCLLLGDLTARIGSLHHDRSLPAFVKTDDLLGKHFAVLGTTGSGKSCAVTVILKSLLRENPHARMLLLDPHNEYAQAFGEEAQMLDPAVYARPALLAFQLRRAVRGLHRRGPNSARPRPRSSPKRSSRRSRSSPRGKIEYQRHRRHADALHGSTMSSLTSPTRRASWCGPSRCPPIRG